MMGWRDFDSLDSDTEDKIQPVMTFLWINLLCHFGTPSLISIEENRQKISDGFLVLACDVA